MYLVKICTDLSSDSQKSNVLLCEMSVCQSVQTLQMQTCWSMTDVDKLRSDAPSVLF